MVKEIVHDPILLGAKSELARKEDLQVAQDLLDTLAANKDACVGMAANMIGIKKRIIVFDNEGSYTVMFNPEIVKAACLYDAMEGCLSLLGGPRKCKRWKTVKVRVQRPLLWPLRVRANAWLVNLPNVKRSQTHKEPCILLNALLDVVLTTKWLKKIKG